MSDEKDPATGPGVERTITLVDAVVAIAMTLLILPLVDVAGDLESQDIRHLLTDHGDLLLSFLVSFVVIYRFWAAHGTIYRRLRRLEREDDLPGLPLLNLWWLVVIAFLPFPTALIGRNLNTVTGPVYLATLFVLSALTLGMTILVHRAAGLPMGLGWLSTVVFAIAVVISLFDPRAGVYFLLVLIVIRRVENHAFGRAVGRTNRATDG